MNAKNSRGPLIALCLTMAAALTLANAPRQSAAADDAEGRVVDITSGQNRDEADESVPADKAEEAVEQPKYWIGIQGQPVTSDVLRTQLQLADDVGVVVHDIVPGSPAEKAGLRKHDVLIGIGDEQITDMASLQKAVLAHESKPLELKLIRLAKEMTLKVTPEEAPADMVASAPAGENMDFGSPEVNEMMKRFGMNGARAIGPGMLLERRFDLNHMPNGLSVQITRDGEGPATITVKKGEESWTVEGDDKEALKKLPDDVRPFVQQMLQSPQPGNQFRPNFNFGELQNMLPDQLGRFELQGERASDALEHSQRQMIEQMDRMQQRLDDMRRQLQKDPPATEKEGASDRST